MYEKCDQDCRRRARECGTTESIIKQKLAGSMIDPGQQNSLRVDLQTGGAATLAEAANAPRCTTAAAASATATAAGPAAAATTAAATAAAAAPGHLLHAALARLLVEEMEGGEAYIGDLFLAKHETLIGDIIERLRHIVLRQRGCGCAARHGKTQSSDTQSRHCGGFGDALPRRSLFHP